MKKFFVAMMALCAMAVSFTSCNQADPAKEPIAGKTYMYTDPEAPDCYVKFAFHMNHKVSHEIKTPFASASQTNLVWEMKANAKDFNIKWGPGMIDTQTGELVEGKILYEGVYDAEKKQITVTMQGAPVVCPEVK